MKKKYFFFDYDGTLALPKLYTIPEENKTALMRLKEQGHFLCLATGRLQCNAMKIIKDTCIDCLIADGGNSLTINDKLIFMKPLEDEHAKKCLRDLHDAGFIWSITTENQPLRYTPYRNYPLVDEEYHVPTKFVPDLNINTIGAIYKIYVYTNNIADQDKLIKSGILDNVPWATYKIKTLFIEPANKDIGIKQTMDYLGVPYEDAVVFGDAINDLSMFQPEWTSIAMGNAVPELKEKADYVTTDVDKNGIGVACEHFGWI